MMSGGSGGESSIHYSLNDMTLTVGYMQVNEYLLAENSLDKWESSTTTTVNNNNNKSSSSSSASRKAKQQQAKILEISQAASVIELITFQDQGSNSAQIEQPCVKVQVTLYDPLDLITPVAPPGGKSSSSSSRSFGRRGSAGARLNELNRMLSRSFENVSIQLNHCLSFELDISLVDRLYYIINDVSKPTFGSSTTTASSGANAATFSTFGPNRPIVQNKNKSAKVNK